MITESIIAGIVEGVVSNLVERVQVGESSTAFIDREVSRTSLKQHLRTLARWADEISFKELRAPRRLSDSFIDLDLHLGNTRSASADGMNRPFRVSDIPDIPGHLIVLGDPGAGKTTSLKRVAIALLNRSRHPGAGFPLLIQLREIEPPPHEIDWYGKDSDKTASRKTERPHRRDETLSDVILRTLGFTITYADQLKLQDQRAIAQRIVCEQLERNRITLLIDGLDEIHPSLSRGIIADLRSLLLNVSVSRIILTCRKGAFVYQFENAHVMTLNALDDDQIANFAAKWLGHEDATHFLRKVHTTPYAETQVRPLTLAHLCAIYQRTKNIPKQPKTVYRKIVHLLLEEWDEQRSVQRVSRYANFEVDRKAEFLQAIAYRLTLLKARGQFSHTQLEKAYSQIHTRFELPASDVNQVVGELESHSGLIIQVEFEIYAFAHKSLQEYLAAAHAVRLSGFPKEFYAAYPDEVALTIALAADPNSYFHDVVQNLIAWDRSRIFPTGLAPFVEPLLRRIVVERVEFAPNEVLGRTVLELMSATYHLTHLNKASRSQRAGSHKTSDAEATIEFLSQPVIAQSADLALRGFIVNPRSEGGYHIMLEPRGGNELVLDSGLIAAINSGKRLDWLHST